MAVRQKSKFAIELSTALKLWSEGPNGIDLESLRDELGVDRRSWRDVLSGSRIIESRMSDLYAVLFRRTQLLQADPTNIPNRPGQPGMVRRWSFKNLTTWWEKRFPDEFETKEVQQLLSQTRGAKESGYLFEEPSGNESQELVSLDEFLTDLMEGESQARAEFCLTNRDLLRRLSEKMLVLSSQTPVREGVLKLKGVVK